MLPKFVPDRPRACGAGTVLLAMIGMLGVRIWVQIGAQLTNTATVIVIASTWNVGGDGASRMHLVIVWHAPDFNARLEAAAPGSGLEGLAPLPAPRATP